MTLTELSTAAEFNIGCKILILNNDEQGMVTQWQTLFFEDRFSHTHQKNADFVKLGDAMGVQAKRVIKPDELEGALKWLIESDGPALLEVVVDQKVPVLDADHHGPTGQRPEVHTDDVLVLQRPGRLCHGDSLRM